MKPSSPSGKDGSVSAPHKEGDSPSADGAEPLLAEAAPVKSLKAETRVAGRQRVAAPRRATRQAAQPKEPEERSRSGASQKASRPLNKVTLVKDGVARRHVLRVTAHEIPDVGRTYATKLNAAVGNTQWLEPVLLDTGATHSIMDRNTYERLRDPKLPQLVASRMTLRGAFEGKDQEEIQTLGLWPRVPVKIGGASYFADFHICPVATVPIILGTDFLMEHKAQIGLGDPSEVRLTSYPDGEGHDDKAGESHRHAVMRVDALVHLSARTAKRVPVFLDSVGDDGTYVFESAVEGHELLVPSQLMTVRQGRSTVLVENRGLQPHTLDSPFLGSACAVAKGDETSRHPGVDAIFRPASYAKGGVEAVDEGLPRTPAGMCAFIHVEDFEPLCQRVGNGDTPLTPERHFGALSEPLFGAAHHRDAHGEERSKGASAATGKVRSVIATAIPEPSAKQTRSANPGTGASSPAPEAKTGLPDHLRCMMPPQEDTSTAQRRSLESLINEYEDIFIGPGDEVGYTDRTSHVINVGDALPVKIPPRKTSFAEKELIEKTVTDLLHSGKIRGSNSPWASPIVLVKKKDGTMRFCIDYRRVNDVTVKDAYPLPRIEDALDYLNGAKYFSALDLASAYWQVAMHPDSIDKTAFATHIGLYEWLVMPFGLSNAPATCERLMEQLFQGLQWNGVLVYLDDLVAYGENWHQALNRLRLVFLKLREANLTLKPSKCFLMTRETEYLGHRVCAEGIFPGQRKIEAVRHWPVPSSIDEVRSFLGLTGYYRKFVKNYAELAHPLVSLMKKGMKYEWGPAQQSAYEQLREALVSYPCLGAIRPEGRLILDTDASDYAVGAVLSQVQDGLERVLGYFSRTLNDAQTRYCTTKKELLAVKSGLEFWDHYLQNPSEPFLLRTDHAALSWLRSMSTKDRTLARWATYVSEYQYECEHRPGRHHSNADALSRVRYRPCELDDCLCCKRGTNPTQFPPGEETRLREHAELEIDRTGGRSTINVHFLTRGQRRALEQSKPRPADPYDLVTPVPDKPPGRRRTRPNGEAPVASRTRSRVTPKPAPHVEKDYCTNDASEVVPDTTSSSSQQGLKGVADTTSTKGDVSQRTRPMRRGRRGRKSGAARQRKRRAKPAETPADKQSLSPEKREIGGDGDNAKPSLSPDELFAKGDVAAWTRKDWYALQRGDPISKRVLALKIKYGDQSLPDGVLDSESKEVRLICRSWALLTVVKGTLKHRIGEPSENGAYSVRWERIVVPQKSRVELVRVVHSAAAHLSFRRVYPLMKERFWWRTMGTDLRDWTRCCELCQQLKVGDKRGRYPLSQEGYSFPLDRVGIDISGPWPCTSGGQKYILAITDYFSKWLELAALPDKTAMSVARELHRFVSRYGIMDRLHSDRGKEFTAQVIRHLCEFCGVKQTFTSGHAPWSNAQVERANRTVRSLLLTLTRQHRMEWDECLPAVMQAYNSTVHASTGYTPSLLMHSRCENPRLPVDLLLTPPTETLLERNASCYSEYIEEQRLRVQRVHSLVREHLGKAATMQSRMHEKGGLRPHRYTVGSEVWYYYPANVTSKLGSPWIGPLSVIGVDLEKNLVKVPLRGGERWINGANVKPVRRLGSGGFL